MTNLLFTVCGRAGSKGLKNKNLKLFAGRPLVHYTLAAIAGFRAKYGQGYTIHSCINTDSAELKTLCTDFDSAMLAIDREPALAGDSVSKMAVIQDSLCRAERHYEMQFDLVVDLDITSPLRTIADIDKVIKQLEDENRDVVFSVAPARRNPFFNMVIENPDGTVKKVLDSDFTARQQAPRVFDMNASIYAYRSAFLRENKNHMLWGGNCGAVVMRDTAVLDIDSEEDFELMEVLMGYFVQKYPDYRY